MRRTLWILLIMPLAMAQQPATLPNGDHEAIQELLKRVRDLEAEVKELKEQRRTAALPVGEAAPPGPMQGMDLLAGPDPGSSSGPTMQFRGFADINYRAPTQRGAVNTFTLGQMNLFITSKLSDRLSVLAEAVIGADPTNVFSLDLERLLLQYSANDYFNLSFGRYHTAIGFYNTAYHHSTWLQTATDRPFLFAFDDQGGILPTHNVGVSASGRVPSGGLGLHYVAELGNGRRSRSLLDEPVQNFQDENNGKAINLAVFARPDWIRGFQAGFSMYRDRLTPRGFPKINQTIFAAHAIYQGRGFEFLNEAIVVRNALRGTRTVLHTPAFYTQFSRQFGKARPFFRYQYVNVPGSDPIFGDVGLLHGPSAGIRYDFNDFMAFKLQYDHTQRERQVVDRSNGVSTQLSFTF